MATNFLLSIISGVFIGTTAGFLGSLMLSKRMALVAGPLGHLTLPGVALALIYGFNISLFAFPFVIFGILLIWLFEKKTKLPVEALVAITFAFFVSFAFLFLPINKAEEALVGDITKVGLQDTAMTVLISLFVFLICTLIYKKMILVNISEDLAKAEGVNVKKYNLLYLFAIALIVSLGVKLVGGLLTAALVAIPSASARNLSKNLKSYKILAPLFGGISVIFGIFASTLTHIPAGPLTILFGFLIFVISCLAKR
jgi:ABC-type Mn2+/Zn2+ transport system permease subunit